MERETDDTSGDFSGKTSTLKGGSHVRQPELVETGTDDRKANSRPRMPQTPPLVACCHWAKSDNGGFHFVSSIVFCFIARHNSCNGCGIFS